MTQSELLFAAEASCRYHEARARFFEGFANLLTILSVVLGGGAFVALMSSVPAAIAQWVALGIAVLNTYRFVAKPDARAGQHRTWAKQWADLKTDLQATSKPSSEQLRAWIGTHSTLNVECSGEMIALNRYCFNQTAKALGRTVTPYPLKWRHRAFKHIFKFTHAFDHLNLD